MRWPARSSASAGRAPTDYLCPVDNQAIAREVRRRQARETLEFEREREQTLKEQVEIVITAGVGWLPRAPPWVGMEARSRPRPGGTWPDPRTWSASLRETQVDGARRRIGPAARHDLAARVEAHALRPVRVEVAEERRLPP